MRMFTWIVCLTSMAALGSQGIGAQPPPPPAPQVTVTATTNSSVNPPTTTLTVTVSNLPEGTLFKDLHVLPASKRVFPKLGGTTGSNVPVTPLDDTVPQQTWRRERSQNGRQLDLYANNAAGFGNGTYTIPLVWSPDEFDRTKQLPITWEATKDGNKEDNPNDGIDDGAGDAAPNLPQFLVTANGDEDLACALGSDQELPVQTAAGFQGMTYRIYTSTKLVPNYDDALGIGIASTTHPVPTSWNLDFLHFSGAVQLDGGAAPAPRILVPESTPGSGQVFYLVYAVEREGSIFIASQPITVKVG